MHPKAREEDLLIKELAEETVVYDRKRNEAHCLNRTAALIWRHCDGQTSAAELVTLLRKRDLPADEAVVWLALDRLENAHLLQEPLARSDEAVSRRQVMRKLGTVGGLAILLPQVASIVVASPVQHESLISVSNDSGCCQFLDVHGNPTGCDDTITHLSCTERGGVFEDDVPPLRVYSCDQMSGKCVPHAA
jgi:hypothetical protein